MIGFLKTIGVVNAAAWFGAALSCTLIASPAIRSDGVRTLLGTRYFPYFSGAIDQVMASRFGYWLLAFALVALLHLGAEKIHLGRTPRRGWLGLVLALAMGVGVLTFGLQPRLRHLHLMRHAVNTTPAQRESYHRSFVAWSAATSVLSWLMIGGLGLYLCRLASPPETTRFVSPGGKFRC